MNNSLRVLVCGGRKYADAARVWYTLDGLLASVDRITIIEGGATGADMMARMWVERRQNKHNVTLIDEPALWSDLSHPDANIKTRADGSRYDANAGPRRNKKMLAHRPDIVVAFPGGKGTRSMCRLAKQHNVPVRKCGWQ